ncbi:hypothetical protein DFJ63DRAFT_60335 [Scheffersomyces coipomensis]|uniref:uncharacterized protein n=1 Tax=Scheffersomyces coipomensis TaxID=1788519 RepID=UPI00315CFD78
MVLKNSKWDKKAKYSYMKKHGISSKPKNPVTEEVKKKWSGKQVNGGNDNRIELNDSDEEYDSEVDDALLEHFYPSLGEAELSRDQKIKIKQQIISDLEQQEAEESDVKPEDEKEVEIDGIYLGSDENKHKEMATKDETPKFNLEDFMANAEQQRTKKNRKLLNNKVSDNFLEEYGLSSYNDLNRNNKDDYNDMYYAKRGQRNLNEVSSKELDGFVIGEQSIATTGNDIRSNNREQQAKINIKYLSQEETDQDKERAEKVEKEKLYKEIKRKFDTSKPISKSKVLEINTLNNDDHLSSINANLINNAAKEKTKISDTDLDADLDFLLGGSGSTNSKQSSSIETTTNKTTDIDAFLSDLTIQDKTTTNDNNDSTSVKPQPKHKPNDLDFLDELLG